MTKENMQQINELKEMIIRHCDEQVITDAAVAERLELLMPLADLIPTLQEIAENQKVNVAMNKRFAAIARALMAIGGVIAAIYGIISLIFRLRS